MNTAGLQKIETVLGQFQQPEISKTLSIKGRLLYKPPQFLSKKKETAIIPFSNHICVFIMRVKGKKEAMEETIRQLTGQSAPIYPMQSEIIAHHSVVLVPSVKSQRKEACEVSLGDDHQMCAHSFSFRWPQSLRLKPNSA